MTYKTDAFEDALNEWIYGGTAVPTIVNPGTITVSSLAIGIFTTNPTAAEAGTGYVEVANANAYARVGIVRGTDFLATGSTAGTISNAIVMAWPAAASPSGWGDATGIGIFYHATNAVTYGAGVLWAWTTIGGTSGTVTINSGDTPQFNAGKFTIIED